MVAIKKNLWSVVNTVSSREKRYRGDEGGPAYQINLYITIIIVITIIIIIIIITIIIVIIITRSSTGLTVPSAATQGWEASSSTSLPPTIPD